MDFFFVFCVCCFWLLWPESGRPAADQCADRGIRASGLVLQLAAQHDVAKAQGIVQPDLVGLADDALRQGLALVGGQQDNVHLVGHVHALLLFGGQHLQVDDVGLFQRAVVDVVAAAHQRAALVGQLGGICHGKNHPSCMWGRQNSPPHFAECAQGSFAAKSTKNRPSAALPSLGVHKGRRRSGALPATCFCNFPVLRSFAARTAKPKLPCACSALLRGPFYAPHSVKFRLLCIIADSRRGYNGRGPGNLCRRGWGAGAGSQVQLVPLGLFLVQGDALGQDAHLGIQLADLDGHEKLLDDQQEDDDDIDKVDGADKAQQPRRPEGNVRKEGQHQQHHRRRQPKDGILDLHLGLADAAQHKKRGEQAAQNQADADERLVEHAYRLLSG